MCSKNLMWSRIISQFHNLNAPSLWLNRACFCTPASKEPLNVTVPIKELRCDEIPRNQVKKTFVRSSGAGGQNVNKLNTKAEIRFNVHEANWIPERLKEQFMESSKGLINNVGECIISSQVSRIQAENLDDCFVKLQSVLDECSKDLIESLRIPTEKDEKVLKEKAAKAVVTRRIQKEASSERKRSRRKDLFY